MSARRLQSTTTTNASTAAKEAATKAQTTASEYSSKATQGLSRVTSAAGPAIAGAAQGVAGALGRVGGPVGRLVAFIERTPSPPSLLPLPRLLVGFPGNPNLAFVDPQRLTKLYPTTGQTPFVIYYSKVGLELTKLVAKGQSISLP